MAAISDRPIKGRRADWLTELVWKRAQQLAVLYPQDMLLDVACGDGELLSRFVQSEPEAGFAGICDTPQDVRTARQRVPEADIMYAELDDFPWLNQSFDVVLCLQPFSAMVEFAATFAEAFRVLKPGGQLLLAVPWMPSPFRNLANRFLTDDTDESADMLSTKQLTRCLEDVGFKRVSTVHLAFLRCLAICWKP